MHKERCGVKVRTLPNLKRCRAQSPSSSLYWRDEARPVLPESKLPLEDVPGPVVCDSESSPRRSGISAATGPRMAHILAGRAVVVGDQVCARKA